MAKKRLTGIILTLTMIFSMLLPLCSVTYAEVVTNEGYAMATFGEKEVLENMKIVESGSTKLTGKADGEVGRVLSATDDSSLFIYCDIDDTFLNDIPKDIPIDITVEYFDAKGGGSLSIAYDSYNPQPEYPNAVKVYRSSETFYLEGTETWKTHTWTLEDMKMTNRCGGSDFRLQSWDMFTRYSKTDVIVKSIKVNVGEFENPTNVSIQSERIGNIFSDRDKTITLDVSVQNKSFDQVKGEYNVRIYDKLTNREVHTEKFELGVDARSTNKHTFSFANPGRNTIYSIDIDETVWTVGKEDVKKQRIVETECSVAMLADEPEERSSFYGCMSSVIRHGKGNPDEVYQQMANVGATWQREEFTWSLAEPVKGQLALPAGSKEAWQHMKDAGLNLIFICMGVNPHYDGGKTPASDEAIAAFANYCAFMARELKGITNYFEIWNEWNIVNFNPSKGDANASIGGYASQISFSVGYVTDLVDGVLKIGKTKGATDISIYTEGVPCVVYDKNDERNSVSAGSIASAKTYYTDGENCSMVVLSQSYGAPKLFIIYK